MNDYNGWSNYETWNWKLWMDQGSQEYWADTAKDIVFDTEPEHDWQTPRDAWIAELVARLTYDMDEQAESLDNVGAFADILNAGLGRINWREIAESLIDEVTE